MNNFFNDLVSDYDYLGYSPYIEAFSYVINNHNKLISPPFVFGIHGKWGTGKSTFMNLIEKKLANLNKFYIIDINPWEYGDNQNFITIFLAKLYQQARAKKILQGKDSAKEFIEAIFKPLKLSLDIKPIRLDYDFSKFSIDEQKNVLDSFVSENFALKESINKLLEEKFFNEKKIIVFIDDLDRCSVNKIMEVIESIKLLFNSKNCIFFLGCDTSYLEGALLSKHQELIEFAAEETKDDSNKLNIKKFSREYLEKIIQIPFYIPAITQETIKEYIDSILHNDNKSMNEIKVTEDLFSKFNRDLGDNFISELIVIADLNPRRIKRMLNLIFLNYIFMKFKNTNIKSLVIDIKLLSLIAVIREVVPEYYKIHLSSENDCSNTFKRLFEYYYIEIKAKNENELDSIQLEKSDMIVYDFFKLYFQYQKINEKRKLEIKLKDILLYISVSNIMTSENYNLTKWGDIGELKADTNGKKLKIFLDIIYNNNVAKEIVLSFFKDIFIFNRDKYAFGLVKNILVYKKDINGLFNPEKDLLFRFEFDEKINILFISFEWRGRFKSIIREPKDILTTSKYKVENNRIEIDINTTEQEIEILKYNIKELIKSANETMTENNTTLNGIALTR